jgi:hypothetical protein
MESNDTQFDDTQFYDTRPPPGDLNDLIAKIGNNVNSLIDELVVIYNGVKSLKETCESHKNESTTMISQLESEKSQMDSENKRVLQENQERIDMVINELSTIRDEKYSSEKEKDEKMENVLEAIRITEQAYENTIKEKDAMIEKMRSEIERCANEKVKIVEELTKIDSNISQQIEDGGIISQIKSYFNVQSGGFNWRSAAETKKLLSSRSSRHSSKFLHEKDSHSKKSKKSTKSSQRMKSKKNKKGVFKNLGLFRKK